MSKHEKLLIGLALIPLALLGWIVWKRWQERKRQAEIKAAAETIFTVANGFYE